MKDENNVKKFDILLKYILIFQNENFFLKNTRVFPPFH